MKLAIAMILTLVTLPLAQAQKDCLPIGLTTESKVRAVLGSELVNALSPALDIKDAEKRRAEADLSTLRISREEQETIVILDYTIRLQNPVEEVSLSYAFKVIQTCDGKLEVSYKRWGTPVGK